MQPPKTTLARMGLALPLLVLAMTLLLAGCQSQDTQEQASPLPDPSAAAAPNAPGSPTLSTDPSTTPPIKP